MQRILVAYDGTEAAYRALERAAEDAQADDGAIDVVTVASQHVDEPQEIAQQAAAYLFDHGFEPQVHTPLGDPAGQIRHLADQGGYDAVYLGTRGHGSPEREAEGSISGAVVELAHVTTVVVR